MIELISQIIKFIFSSKKFWLIPIFFIIIFFGSLIVLTQGTAISPFIYTIF